MTSAATPDLARADADLRELRGDRVRLAYGDNWDRLRRARHRYDPMAVFSAVPTLAATTGGG